MSPSLLFDTVPGPRNGGEIVKDIEVMKSTHQPAKGKSADGAKASIPRSVVPDPAKAKFSTKLFRQPELADLTDFQSRQSQSKIERFIRTLRDTAAGRAETLLPGACELACCPVVPEQIRYEALLALRKHGPVLTDEIARALDKATNKEKSSSLLTLMNQLITEHEDSR